MLSVEMIENLSAADIDAITGASHIGGAVGGYAGTVAGADLGGRVGGPVGAVVGGYVGSALGANSDRGLVIITAFGEKITPPGSIPGGARSTYANIGFSVENESCSVKRRTRNDIDVSQFQGRHPCQRFPFPGTPSDVRSFLDGSILWP